MYHKQAMFKTYYIKSTSKRNDKNKKKLKHVLGNNDKNVAFCRRTLSYNEFLNGLNGTLLGYESIYLL